MNKSPIIKIENLSQTIGKEIILKDFSTEINEFDFVSLKGPSGCGKTTILRILAGLTAPTTGKIFLNGKLANSPKILIPPHLRSINLLFQDLALWPHMTGFEQLKFVWESTKINSLQTEIDKICGEIGLNTKLLSKYPSRLSRGEQQRLAIARCLINQPKIILFDEPLTALDQNLRSLFVSYLKKIKKEKNMTVIMVSHDLMTDSLEYDIELMYNDSTFVKLKK